MFDVYLKAASFLVMIVCGNIAKRMKIFPPDFARNLAKLNINLVLPCMVIINFSGSTVDLSLILLLFYAVVQGLILCAAAAYISRNMSDRMRGTYIINAAGHNIGSFSTPFVMSFLPPLGTVATCVFDTGNALISTGGSFSFAQAVLHSDGDKFSVTKTLKRLFSSPCIDTYVIMFILSVIGIKIPNTVLTLIRPMANANVFMAMFMLGLMFRIEFKMEYLGNIVKILGLRLGFGVIFALIGWYLLPFDLPVRQAMVLMPFSPITSVSPAFTSMLKDGDEGLAGCVNSISIVLGIVILTGLVIAMGL